MITRYFVDFKVHNKENDGWAYKTELNTNDYDKALVKYFEVCKTYIGVTTFDHVLVTITDAFGNTLEKQVWDMKVVEPTTETE